MMALTVKLVLYASTVAACAFYLLSIVAGFRFFERKRDEAICALVPVSIMIPLRGANFKAYQNYTRLCQQEYPEYQVVFGVRDADDSSIPIVRKLIADFPSSDIELVVCPDVIG